MSYPLATTDRLKNQNLHYKRVLDRQLTEIEVRHRQSEAKRQKEVRRLGIDLTKLQKSTRNLDEVLCPSPTDGPKLTARRASFSEFSNSPRPLTSPALIPGRRNSVTTVNLLSRSRKELAGLSPSSSPKSSSQNGFDFKINLNRRSTLPEIDNNVLNNNNSSSNNKNSNNSSRSNNNNNIPIAEECENKAPLSDNSNTTNVDDEDNNNNDNISNNSNDSTNRVAEVTVVKPADNLSNNSNQFVTNAQVNLTKQKDPVVENSAPSTITSTEPSNTTTYNPVPAMTGEGERRGSKSNLKITISSSPTSSSSSSPPIDVKNQPRRGSKTGLTIGISSDGKSPTRAGRRGSLDSISSSGSSPRNKKSGKIHPMPEVSHNETIVYVHREGDVPLRLSPEPSESGSMFAQRKCRRASEPAIGGHFLRNLQSISATDDDAKARVGGHSPMRKTIAEELPSGIVAEEDEDRYNEEIESKKKTKNDNKSDGQNDITTETKQKRKSESASGRRRSETIGGTIDVTKQISHLVLNETNKTTSKETTGQVLSSSPSETSSMHSTKKSANGKKSSDEDIKKMKTRRKSEADVLRFAKIWRLYPGKVNSLREHLKENKDEVHKPQVVDSKDEIWDAVRKCRYIRGYNPPDMAEPSNLGEYVFGRQTTDSPPLAE